MQWPQGPFMQTPVHSTTNIEQVLKEQDAEVKLTSSDALLQKQQTKSFRLYTWPNKVSSYSVDKCLMQWLFSLTK